VQPNRHLQKQLLKICNDFNEKRQSAQENLKNRLTYDFFINMAICNTVVVNAHPHKDSMGVMGGVAATDSAPIRQQRVPATLAPQVFPVERTINEKKHVRISDIEDAKAVENHAANESQIVTYSYINASKHSKLELNHFSSLPRITGL